jgi:hypothetical protein
MVRLASREMVKYLPWLPPPPPGLYKYSWLVSRGFVPFFRALERMGVYFYNNVIHRTEIGLYDKNYNPRVHGPYQHHVWYGKREPIILYAL